MLYWNEGDKGQGAAHNTESYHTYEFTPMTARQSPKKELHQHRNTLLTFCSLFDSFKIFQNSSK